MWLWDGDAGGDLVYHDQDPKADLYIIITIFKIDVTLLVNYTLNIFVFAETVKIETDPLKIV